MGTSTTTLSYHLPGNVACHYQSSCYQDWMRAALMGSFHLNP